MPTLEFQAIVNSLQSAIFTPGNLVTVSAMTTVANVPVLDLTVNQIDTDSFTLDETTTPPTLRITAHPEQSPWHSPIDAAGFYLYDLQYLQFADGTIQTTAFNAGTIGQTPWLQDIQAAGHGLLELQFLRFSDLTQQVTAFPGIAAVQTPWLQPINAQGFNLTGFGYLIGGGIELRPLSSQFPLTVRNSANTAWNWYIDTGGELVTDTARTISKIGAVSFSDGTIQTTAYKGIAATQTPWLQNIDGAGRSLTNVATLGVNSTSTFGDVMNGVGLVITRPAPSNALVIYAPAQAAIDWMIDSAGNLLTLSNRFIDGLGHIKFQDGTIQTTAFASGSGAQTPWQTNIDGAGHLLFNVLGVGVGANGISSTGTIATSNAGLVLVPKAGDNAVVIYNAGATGADWAITPDGSLVTNTGRGIYNISTLRFSDSTNQITAFPGIAATQTPWHQDIDAGLHQLTSVGAITIAPASGVLPLIIYSGTLGGGQVDWYVHQDGSLNSNTTRSITTGGYLNGGGLIIRPVGVSPVQIVNQANTGNDWQIDGVGDLTSPTHREIRDAVHLIMNDGTNAAAVFSATVGVILASTQKFDWTNSANYNGGVDIRLSRQSAGVLNLSNPVAGTRAVLCLQTLNADNYIANVDNSIAIGPGVIGLGNNKSIQWSADGTFYGAPDIRFDRFGAGSLILVNPAGTTTGVTLSTHTFRAQSTVVAEQFQIYSTGAMGLGTTFLTGDGKTVTVVGGIITRIV